MENIKKIEDGKIYPKELECQDIINIKQQKSNRLNTCVYVDYENIIKQLEKYNVNPISIQFFLKIIDFILYSNFDCEIFARNAQTELQGIGLQTRHTSNKGKNSGDLEMSIDALRTLYKNNYIDVFVIMSCDRDMIPLIKAIKAENKIAYVISTKIGFNKVVTTYADEHKYIEDLFDKIDKNSIQDNLKEVANDNNIQNENNVKEITLITDNIKTVCKCLFKFKYWEEYLKGNGRVTVKGFTKSVIKKIDYKTEQVDEILKAAKDLKYVDLIEENNELIIVKNVNTFKYMKEISK